MKTLVNVKDNRETFMMEPLNSFQFVRAEPLTSFNNEVLKGLKEAVLEVNQIKAGKKKAQPLNEFLDAL